jgi:phage host-nuclease inhibitor protein Gam
MENRREYIDKMAARLKDLEREIIELEKIADKAVAEVKAEYHQQIEDLFLKKEVLQNNVSKISEASGNAWEDMKAGAELSWEVFQDSLKRGDRKP